MAVHAADVDQSDMNDLIFGFSGFVFETRAYTVDLPTKHHPRAVSIDTLATENFGWNTELMDNLTEVEYSITGVSGKSTGKKMGDIPGFGIIAHTPESGVNALSSTEIETRYRVRYCPMAKFIVYVSSELSIEFNYMPEARSYTAIFTDELLDKLRSITCEGPEHDEWVCEREAYNIATVSGNEALYSEREVKRAKEARTLMRRLYYPSDVGLARTLTHGVLLEAPVTANDVVLATRIYGKDVASLKGKSKDMGPVASNDTLVPSSAVKQQSAFADLFMWRGQTFLLFIMKPLGLLMTKCT